MWVLVVGRSLRGYEGFIARGFAGLGFHVAFIGYEDILRLAGRGSLGWLGGVALRRLLVSSVLHGVAAGSSPLLGLYGRLVAVLVERLEPGLVFVVKGEALTRWAIKALADAVPERGLAYFNPDDPRYGGLVERYAGYGFTVFTPCHACLPVLRERYGAGRVYLLPFAAEPMPRFRCGLRVRAAVFIGSFYPERLRVIRRLLRSGVPLVVAGPGWRYFVPGASAGLYGQAYVAATRVAYAALNVHNRLDLDYKPNMRVFEIPGAGGVEVTDNAAAVEPYYRPGRELFTYRDLGELEDLLRDILSWDAEELCGVARRGYERTRSEHTYWHRALAVTRAAGLRPPGGRGSVVDAAWLLRKTS